MMRKFLIFSLLSFVMVNIVACDKKIDDDDDIIPPINSRDSILAFPGAQGGAAYITGGRGGMVYYVTTLEDIPTYGSLRYGLMTLSGRRTILFKVSGTIELRSELKVNNGNVTVAGQSAPGDGICIKNYPLVVSANNVIIRFLRFRMGDEKSYEGDALTVMGRTDVMIDHCSMSWGTDECVSAYDNTNFTLQWSIISESLRNSVHNKGAHGYAGIWGGKKASFHHNLIAHHDSRNPRFCGSRYSNDAASEKVDLRNNVMYNWGNNSGYAGEGGSYNIVNNYYKPGPASYAKGGLVAYRIFAPNSDDGTNNQPKGVWGKFHVSGNIMHNNNTVTNDNWHGMHLALRSGETTTKADIRSDEPFEMFSFIPKTAQEAYDDVLVKAGASLVRDAIDARIITEVQNGTYTYTGSNGSRNGIIDTQTDVGGWPVYAFEPSQVPLDTDGDGIPDYWEDANGLDKNSPVDGSRVNAESDGYTNLELYLNSLVEHLF
ncbi:MAG: pectate lyase [Paludibacter sp.]|nr:pectate lyase [Paludibacter sp.]